MLNSDVKLYEALVLALIFLMFTFIGYLMGRYIHKEKE